MSISIISILRMALAAALPLLAALACAAPAPTVAPTATLLCNEPYRSRQGVDR